MLTKTTSVDGSDHIISLGTDPGGGGSISDGVEVFRNRIRYAGTYASLHGIFIGEGVDKGEVAYNDVDIAAMLGLVIKGGNSLCVHHNTIVAPICMYLKSDSFYNAIVFNTCYSTKRTATLGTPCSVILQKSNTGGLSHPKFNTISNNIFVAVDSGAFAFHDDTDNDEPGVYAHGCNRLDHNLYYVTGTAKLATLQGVEYTTIETLRAAWAALPADADGWLRRPL